MSLLSSERHGGSGSRKSFGCAAFVTLYAAAVLLVGCGREDPATTVASVTPSSAHVLEEVTVTIEGEGFVPEARLWLGGDSPQMASDGGYSISLDEHLLEEVRWVDGGTLTAHVPAGLPVGTYDLEIFGPGERAAVLEDGFQVFDGEVPQGPVISRLEPPEMPVTGGELAIIGTALTPDTEVLLDDMQLEILDALPERVDVVVPALEEGDYRLELHTRYGLAIRTLAVRVREGGVRILSPSDGDPVAAGFSFPVTVSVEAEREIESVSAWAELPDGSEDEETVDGAGEDSMVETFSFTVPSGASTGDTVSLGASAVLAGGDEIFAQEISLVVTDHPPPSDLWLEPGFLELSVGESRFLRLYATYADGSVREIGGEMQSELTVDSSHAEITPVGVVTGISVGSATVTAVGPEGRVAEASVEVVEERLALEPGRLLMAPGQLAPLRLTVVSGGDEEDLTADAVFVSADLDVAEVVDGEVLAKASGVTTVFAQHDERTVEVEVLVAELGDGLVELEPGAAWFAVGPHIPLDGLLIQSGATLAGYGPECLGLYFGEAGLTIEPGGTLDVSGGPGEPGVKDDPRPARHRRGGDGGPGGGGGGGGSVGGEGGAGAPPGESTEGDDEDGGGGGGPGGGMGGPDEHGISGSGSAGGGGGHGGAGGAGGGMGEGAGPGGAGGESNLGTQAGGGSGGGGGDGGSLQGPNGAAGGGGGGGGCLLVESMGGIHLGGEILARGGGGGGVIQASTGGGGGGGSGGSVSLKTEEALLVDGRLCASGGAGGYSEAGRQSQTGAGGGGGGGGRIVLEADEVVMGDQAEISVDGGPGGRVLTGDAEAGDSGEAGALEIIE